MTGDPVPHGRRGTLLVCLAVFGLMAGQQMLNPVLPPLARELGLSELALGLVWTVGGAGVVLASPFWGRVVGRRGHRPVLLASLVGAGIALLTLALVAQAGIDGRLGGSVLFALILLSRGIVFGLSWAATPVAAQSYVVATTRGQAERVRGMSMIGAAMGLGFAVGPALGGLLSGVGLLVPAYVAPAVIALVAVVLWRGMPHGTTSGESVVAVRVSARDARMWPFLVTGFAMYLGLSIVLMTVGFLVQDRFELDAQATGRTAGLVMLAGAAAVIVVQAVVVPRLGWAPPRLIRVGAVVMVAGMAVVTLAPSAILLALGVATLGGGMGLGVPGFTSAPTLLATPEEQGAVAGLVASSSALAFMLAPLVGTALYGLAPVAPYALGAVLLIGLGAFTLTHPALRRGAVALEPA